MFGQKRKQRDFSEEIQAHIDLEIERLEERGLSREEAEFEAHRRFGNMTRSEERFYEAQRWMLLEHLGQDVRFAARMLRRNPLFTAVAVLTLALGIGINTGIFSLIYAVLMRPLPFPQPDRLVAISERRPTSREANLPVSAHEFVAWKEQSHSFEAMAIYHVEFPTLTGRGEPERLLMMRATADLFSVLGVAPLHGRAIQSGEDHAGGARVAVLSENLWRRRFAADPKIVGTSITLDERGYTVVGVMPDMPETFTPELWTPLDLAEEARKVGRHNLSVIGRLKAGITLARAQADLAVVARALEQQMPESNTGHNVIVLSMREDLTGDVRKALVFLTGAVGFVLLIACLNVASLLLTRANGRQAEMAIRRALGASRGRLIRQLLTESVLLAGWGGFLGLMLAIWLARLFSHLHAISIPLAETVRIDRTVLLATTALTVLSGIAAGVAPALRFSRTGAAPAINHGGRSSIDPQRKRLGAALVAGQVAIALVLLVGAGLLSKSFLHLVNVDAGFNTDHLLVTKVALPEAKYLHADQSRRFFSELMGRLGALPGVQYVGGTTNLPLQGGDNWVLFTIEGRPSPSPGHELAAPLRIISPDYFRALGIPLRSGRFFSANDTRISAPVILWYEQQPNPPGFDQPQPPPAALISENMARQYWPGENPLGRRFRILYSPWITVVGVVGDVRHGGLDAPYYPHIYLPDSQQPVNEMTILVRTVGEPIALATAVREQIRKLDASLPVTFTQMETVRSDSVGRQRFYVMLTSVFGALALGLAVVGIFAMASYSVSQRIREIGVRMALGSQRGHIARLILGQCFIPIAAGALAGTAGALILAKLIRSFLFHVSPGDPATLIAALLLVLVASVLALWIPARRAMSVDPNVALRCE